MATGTVTIPNATKGFGSVQPDGDREQVFFHISVVERDSLTGLAEGHTVFYELVTDCRPGGERLTADHNGSI